MSIDVEAFYRRYGPMVLRRCRRLLGDEEEAVDAMQDVFVQALRYRDRLDEKAPSSLLYRMATNTCLNRIRSRTRRPEVPGGELLWQIAGSDDVETLAATRGVLARLFAGEPISSATLAVLHLVDGLTLEEVATAVGLSVSGVRKRLRHLRARLPVEET